MAGHAITRRRDARVTAIAGAVTLAALGLTSAALASAAPRPWTPLAIPIALFLLVALMRPFEPAPGEKFSLGAAIAFFAAIVLPGTEAAIVVAGVALLAKLDQRASVLNVLVNVSVMTASTAVAATLVNTFADRHVLAIVAAGAGYATITLAGVGSMVVASQNAGAALAFVRRELLPTITLASVGGVAALIWVQDQLAILILAIPLAAIERGLRVAARERAAIADLRAANEAQRRFTEDAAHEMRTPLTALIGDLGYVNGDLLEPADADALASARRTAAALRLLTDRLLVFSRSGIASEGASSDLADILRDVVARTSARPGVVVRLAAPASVEVAVGPELLRAVVQDVVSNAAAYTEAGRIEVTVEARGGSASLRVRDTGIGIAPDDLGRVFDRFYRGQRAHSLAPGSGLGLAIVRRIVEAHAGSVTLTSALGMGTTVEITLPRRLGEPEAAGVLERS